MHLFECGLRTERANPNDTDDNKYIAVAAETNNYFDKAFARVSSMINARQHIRGAFNRLQNNSKFTIQPAAGSSDSIYMDEAVRYLLLSSNIIEQSAIRKVWKFLVSQQYDSESLKRDIKHGLAGNIESNI
eukprot:679337_1